MILWNLIETLFCNKEKKKKYIYNKLLLFEKRFISKTLSNNKKENIF